MVCPFSTVEGKPFACRLGMRQHALFEQWTFCGQMAFARRRSCSRGEAEKLVFSQLMIGDRMKWWK
ncbi:hypothetical protein B9L19_00705 [Geobacillus thermocatenulatus]|uniref:Uncharacterized protein n=1 Tax=Geobacillus thermocatenulatus TaxID=33938 RepID=A0AA91YTV6_9BACL|nr:hypothetical protein B9L19_00705 [Geobacillus thermocatenulatus]